MTRSETQANRPPLFSLSALLSFLLATLLVGLLVMRLTASDLSATFTATAAILVFVLGFACGQVIRWRFRLSLRATFVAFTLSIVMCGFLANRIFTARHQRRVVQSINHAGGQVSYEISKDSIGKGWFRTTNGLPLPNWLIDVFGIDFFSNIWTIYFGDELTIDTDLSGVDFHDIENVHFYQSRLSQQSLARIGRLDQLETLCLEDVNLSDDDLKHLINLKDLKNLFVGGNRNLTDPAFSHLGQLKSLENLWLNATGIRLTESLDEAAFSNLRSLSLHGSAITDSEIKNICGLTKLESLQLSNTQVTDVGLPDLGELKNLRHLTLYGTTVTGEGVARLQKLLPKCEIYTD